MLARPGFRRGIVVVFAWTLVGCGSAPSPAGDVLSTPSPSARSTTAARGEPCPVTEPGDGPPDVSPDSLFGWGSSYGNASLWVGGLGPDGVIEAGPEFIAEDGSIGMKFGWWRRVPGSLMITGRRLDATAPPVRAEIPAGYGSVGFQASGVIFPTEGCWEITGQVDKTTLTFVTLVAPKPS